MSAVPMLANASPWAFQAHPEVWFLVLAIVGIVLWEVVRRVDIEIDAHRARIGKPSRRRLLDAIGDAASHLHEDMRASILHTLQLELEHLLDKRKFDLSEPSAAEVL